MSESQLLAAAARRVITPPKGIFLIGYGDRTRGNLGVHDELTATALVLAFGEKKIALVALDLLAINEFIVDRVRAELPGIEAFLCCSHTHSGPIAYADEKSPRLNREYIEALVANIVAAVNEAKGKLSPARLEYHQSEAGIAINRREQMPDGRFEIGRNPQGVVDKSVQLVSVLSAPGPSSAEGAGVRAEVRIATLVNYACHGTVLGPDNLLVSADWIGAMRAKVEAELGGLVLFIQGATANLNPDMDWHSPTAFQTMQAEGESVAASVLTVLRQRGESLPVECLGVERAEVWLPLETAVTSPHPPKKEYRAPLLKMAGLPGWLGFAVDYLLSVRYPWKPRLAARAGFWQVPMRIGVAKLGDLALVAYGAEVFTEIGLAVKAASPAKFTLFASLSDGCVSYLPTAAAHVEGGYEVDTAPYAYRYPGRLQVVCEELALQETRRLLADG